MKRTPSNTVLLDGVDSSHPKEEILIRFTPFAILGPPLVIREEDKTYVCFETVSEAQDAINSIPSLSFGKVDIHMSNSNQPTNLPSL